MDSAGAEGPDVWSRCRISGPSAPVRPAVRLRSTRCGPCQSAAWDAGGYLRALGACVPWFPGHWPPGIGVRTSQGPWHCRPLRGCVSGPSAPALPAGRGAGPLDVEGGPPQRPARSLVLAADAIVGDGINSTPISC